MKLALGEREVLVPDDVEPLTITRATFTPGDVRVSREVCRASVVAGGERVKIVPCRAGLRIRQAGAQDWSVLALNEAVELSDGGAVELYRGRNGAEGVLVQVRAAVAKPVMASPSAVSGWIKVKKLSKSGSSPSPSASPAAGEAPEGAPAKRAKVEENSPSTPPPVMAAHECRGRVRQALFVLATMEPKAESGQVLDERFQSVCELNAQSVLECREASFGDGKVSFWASETKRRGLVCDFIVFGLAKARRQEFKVALGFCLCEAVATEKLAEFLGDAFGEPQSTVEGCMSVGADSQQDVEFQGSEAEQSLASLFASLSTECQPAPQPASVATPLRHHQLQALQWMLDKELVYVHQLPPFWQERHVYGPRPWSTQNARLWGTLHIGMIRTFLLIVNRFNCDRAWHAKFPKPLIRIIADMIPIDTSYRHSLTGIETKRRPRGAKGGILADDMGLGKTLTSIALIVSNPAVPLSSFNAAMKSTPVNYAAFYEGLEKEEEEKEEDAAVVPREVAPKPIAYPKRRPTLIVCPLSVVSNWSDEIENHLGAGCASVLVYHGQKKVQDVGVLARQDVVCTTYGTLVSEFGHEEASRRGPLSRVPWRRLILDEAHYIRNPSFKAALAVDAPYRWCLTATPLQNRTQDLYPLFAVINEEVFSDRSSFKKLITDPVGQNKAEGFIRLRTLMLSACLRRTKDTFDAFGRPVVALPPKTVKQVRVLLSEKEHLVYRAYDTQAIELFAELQKQGIEVVKAKFHFLIVVILRLRQLCDHVALCKDIEQFFVDAREAIESGDVGRLTHRVATAEGCCVCEATSERMFVLPCAHAMCDQHVGEAVEAGQCSCGEQVEAGEVQAVAVNPKRGGRLMLAEDQEPSTKMRKILEIINEMRAKGGPKAKLVLFSQFRQFLDICEDFLRSNGVTTVRIDGTMSRTQRVASMQAFNLGRPEVMLASLMAAGVGINLLGGCNVIIADPWWNPAVENQAMDRVHRIGQTQPVTVHRLVVAGSIEERLLDVQEAKSQLANAALVLRSPEELRELNVKMISKLFSGGTATHVRGKRGRLDANAKVVPFGAHMP